MALGVIPSASGADPLQPKTRWRIEKMIDFLRTSAQLDLALTKESVAQRILRDSRLRPDSPIRMSHAREVLAELKSRYSAQFPILREVTEALLDTPRPEVMRAAVDASAVDASVALDLPAARCALPPLSSSPSISVLDGSTKPFAENLAAGFAQVRGISMAHGSRFVAINNLSTDTLAGLTAAGLNDHLKTLEGSSDCITFAGIHKSGPPPQDIVVCRVPGSQEVFELNLDFPPLGSSRDYKTAGLGLVFRALCSLAQTPDKNGAFVMTIDLKSLVGDYDTVSDLQTRLGVRLRQVEESSKLRVSEAEPRPKPERSKELHVDTVSRPSRASEAVAPSKTEKPQESGAYYRYKNTVEGSEPDLQNMVCDFLIREYEFSELDAMRFAKLLLRADKAGHSTHGLQLLVELHEKYQKTPPKTTGPEHKLQVDFRTDSVAVADGEQRPGALVCWEASDLAASLAKKSGIGVVFVRNSTHNGFPDVFVRHMIHEHGVLALSFTKSPSLAVAPWGHAQRAFGTNPVTGGFPSGDRDNPYVVDFATSSIALNQIRLAHKKIMAELATLKKTFPDESSPEYQTSYVAIINVSRIERGSVIAADGATETNPLEILESDGQTLKRKYMLTCRTENLSHLAQLTDLLCGAMFPESDRGTVGHCFIAIDPSMAMTGHWGSEVGKNILDQERDAQRLRSPKLEPRLSGDSSTKPRAKTRGENVIFVSDAVAKSLEAIGLDLSTAKLPSKDGAAHSASNPTSEPKTIPFFPPDMTDAQKPLDNH